MSKGTTVPPGEPQAFWLRLKYDPDFDHYLVEGSHSFMRPTLLVTSYEANKIFDMYKEQLFHEIEELKRQQRKVKEAKDAKT